MRDSAQRYWKKRMFPRVGREWMLSKITLDLGSHQIGIPNR
jgi:hypothetical protein